MGDDARAATAPTAAAAASMVPGDRSMQPLQDAEASSSAAAKKGPASASGQPSAVDNADCKRNSKASQVSMYVGC